MSRIIKYNRFTDNGSLSREKEDLTYTLFEKLDFINELPKISFFRSDFRGSRFVNVSFYENNFDRADFISAIFEKCLFTEIDIAASEIKNCYFNECNFTLNNYANTSIQECTFENCTFEDEKFLVNMKNCKFINCTMRNCDFERSTTEKLEFNECEIYNTDLATMHAENFIFKSCVLENVSLGKSYIFGYLFYKTDISRLDVLYRGNTVKMNVDNFSEYIISLLTQQRFSEFINANIFLFRNFEGVPDQISNALSELSKINNTTRKLEMTNLFDMFTFYILNNQLPYKLVSKVLNILDDFDWTAFPFEEQLVYISMHKKIEMIMNTFHYDDSFIESAAGETLFVTFRCKTDDYQEALKLTSDLLDDLHLKLGLDKNYKLIQKEKGSWILTFAVVGVVALMMPKMLNDYSKTFFDFSLKRKKLKILGVLLDNIRIDPENIPKSLEQFNLILDTSEKSGLTNPTFDNIIVTEAFKEIVNQIDIGA
ncbi:pentapeptide repeat-containing protein [Paenibacillus sp. 2KB_22]|uniref:pentapeptide repeat-containing protein n=1 Tax=Paenibacillus sp. 2KB_22 TaxID=3232978 RepID=UPI003F998EA9